MYYCVEDMDEIVFKSVVIDGVEYYSAYFSCPVCYERGNRYPPSFWVHASCPDDHIYIGSDATLYCSGCGKKVKIMEAYYVCPNHSKSENHIVAFEGDNIDIEGMSPITMYEAASAVINVCCGKSWVCKLLKSLEIR